MSKSYELYIAPIEEGSGYWENKRLTLVGTVHLGDRGLGRVSRKDVFPMVFNIALEDKEYEVWAYDGTRMYHFLFFFNGKDVHNGQ